MSRISVPLPNNLNTHIWYSLSVLVRWVRGTSNNSCSFGACQHESCFIICSSLMILLSADVELWTVMLSSKTTLTGTKQAFIELLEKCCLMCELALNYNSGTELVPVDLFSNNIAIQELTSADCIQYLFYPAARWKTGKLFQNTVND